MDPSIISPFFQNLLVTVAIGFIIGLEREFNTHNEEGHVGGIRTFPLVAVLGYLSGVISKAGQPMVVPATLAGFILIVGLVYYLQWQKGKHGLTTEVALLSTLLLGLAVSQGFVMESLEVVVVITAILSVKEQVHGIIRQITQEELYAFIKFIILALLVLPMLPDQTFGPEGLINIKDLGWIVVIVLSISFAGYLLLKFGGMKRGILLTALVGGLFSSTMVAWVFSARSREKPEFSAAYSAGIIVSSSVMFVRVYALAFAFYAPLAGEIFVPLLFLLAVSAASVIYIFRQQKDGIDNPSLQPGNPLDIKNAAFFVLLYTTITVGMFYSRQAMGDAGVYASAAVSGMADIDAITISTAKWAAVDSRQAGIAANIILIAVLSNTIFKGCISMIRGTVTLRKWVTAGFGAVLLGGAAWLAVRVF